MIKNGSINDNHEYVLPLTQDYALDPYKGPCMYSFTASDPEKLKKYETYRDGLFAKIRLERENKNGQGSYKPWFYNLRNLFAEVA